jgi:hypothetical protein
VSKKRLEEWLVKNHFRHGTRKDEWLLTTRKINLVCVDDRLHIIDRSRPAKVTALHSGSKVYTCNPHGERINRRWMHTY